jgi:hypothetical protein
MRRKGGLTRYVRDETGTVLVQFTVYLVVIFGMIGLALWDKRLEKRLDRPEALEAMLDRSVGLAA